MLAGKHVTPHVLRHTLAMDLLHHGVGRSVIALWLGHRSVETTAIYLQADVKLWRTSTRRPISWQTCPNAAAIPAPMTNSGPSSGAFDYAEQ